MVEVDRAKTIKTAATSFESFEYILRLVFTLILAYCLFWT